MSVLTRREFNAVLAVAASGAPAIQEGWDWWLPESVKPVPYSGFITWGRNRFSDLITIRGIRLPWRMMCPSPGEYNWKPALEAVEECRRQGMRVGLHLTGVERQSVPEWVIEKYRAPVLDVIPLQENQPWRLQIVPPWWEGVWQEYRVFLQAFGKTGLPQREDVVYGYIHGVSPSRGEELFLRPVDVDDWEKKAGLTPEGLRTCLRNRLESMLEAFRGVEYKLAWMGGGPILAGRKGYERYAKATDGLLEESIARGTGWRSGAVDFQHTMFRSKALGASITPDGYCVIDESLPIHDGRRFLGDENEEYGKSWEWRFGPYEQHGYRHRISSLRGLQLREGFQMVSPETLKLNPDLNEYVARTQGRYAGTSPDAWAYLRECAIQGAPVVKNIERWLLERDVGGYRTEPCERIDRHKLNTDPPGRSYDHDARRTDLKNGQHGMAFHLDPKFWTKPAAAVVKVTFVDRERTSWHLEYASATGKERTAAVGCAGEGKLWTATFTLPSLARSQPADLRLECEGPGDAVVKMVRVIRV